ncbi:MAG: lactonase family protein, partial [Limisphaerales bacterium]
MQPVSRRSFVKISVNLFAGATLVCHAAETKQNVPRDQGMLIAYVGTFSSPLHDVLPTQVDL